eukprot:EG_transcript_16266
MATRTTACLSPTGFRMVAQRCTQLQTLLCTLHVANSRQPVRQAVLSDALLAELWEGAPRLQHFRTSQHPLSAAAFRTAGPALRELWLTDCEVDDVALRTIVLRCPGLRTLVLRAALTAQLSISSAGLAALASLPRLEELDFTYRPPLWEGLLGLVEGSRSLRRVGLGMQELEFGQPLVLMAANPLLALRAGSCQWCREL